MILVIGKTYKGFGRLAAIKLIVGERYYFFIDKDGGIAMIPADVAHGALL